jgi:hypothetical protein
VSDCRRCRERVKGWRGDNPKCGFDAAGNFLTQNWNCATLNALRDLCREPRRGDVAGDVIGVSLWHDDDNVAVLPMPERPEGGHGGFMLVRWYKQRGRTDEVLVWRSYGSIRPATLGDVERVLA